jgi:hypothetical protein
MYEERVKMGQIDENEHKRKRDEERTQAAVEGKKAGNHESHESNE